MCVWTPLSFMTQPPPSYDQVIQEKTQEEHISKPTAAPRRINCTTTSATQTDPQGANSTTSASKCSAATPSSAERRSTGRNYKLFQLVWVQVSVRCNSYGGLCLDLFAGKKPQKPPRPSLPKPGDGRPATKSVRPPKRTAEKTASAGTSEQTSQAAQTNHCDSAALHPSASSQSHQYPVPLPRKKLPKQSTAEQSLVRLGENSDSVDVAPEDESSNKYLKELLEIFSTESRCGDKGDIVNQSDKASESKNAVGEMSTNNQVNMQARIKAFESQTEDGNAVEQVKPEPRPRKAAIKPPVAAKPSVALRSSFTASVDDTSQDVSSTYVPEDHIPAARPEPPKRPVGMSIKEELETIHSKGPPIRPRPSLLSRANCVYEEEPSPLPPVPPVKPPKEPPRPNFNINNHNSTAVINDPDPFSSYPCKLPLWSSVVFQIISAAPPPCSLLHPGFVLEVAWCCCKPCLWYKHEIVWHHDCSQSWYKRDIVMFFFSFLFQLSFKQSLRQTCTVMEAHSLDKVQRGDQPRSESPAKPFHVSQKWCIKSSLWLNVICSRWLLVVNVITLLFLLSLRQFSGQPSSSSSCSETYWLHEQLADPETNVHSHPPITGV